MVDDVEGVAYTTHLGFTLLSNAAPAFADDARTLRLLSGPKPAGRPMDGGLPRRLEPITVVSPPSRTAARRRSNSATISDRPGGSQILLGSRRQSVERSAGPPPIVPSSWRDIGVRQQRRVQPVRSAAAIALFG
jgi:hypothetical protein